MNANKDEAIRAKGIAEDLMKKTDFSGARRVALKAQKLDSTLENISQMIMVCDVHCAATVMSYGNEMDWYGILQVEQTANDSIIKKQYRKLALLLHPDKNKLPGAEAAFKLIGEAQRILLDREKRSIHDMKRKASTSRPVPAPTHRPQHVPTYYYTHPSAQAQSAASSFQTSFWTSCAFCRTRYEYQREFLNSWVSCQQCNKQFTAYEQAAPAAKNFGQATFSFSQQKKVPRQNVCNLGGNYPGNSTSYYSTTKSKGQATHFPQQQPVPNQNACNAEQKCPQSSTSYYSRKESFPVSGHAAKVGTENIGGKRKRKKVVESSESSGSESSNESVEDAAIDENGDVRAGQGFSPIGGQQPRRSVRSKRKVSYKEILSDDDEFADNNRNGPVEDGDGDAERGDELKIGKKHEDDHSKETLSNGVNREKKTNGREKDQCGASTRDSQVPDVKKNSEFSGSKKDSSSGGVAEPRVYECADPDFNDFDKLREEGEFVTGQVWAIYDTADGMPRFYAEIIKVFSPGFKLRIAWLEPDPDDEKEIQWCQGELPVSVGKYRLGKPQITRDHLMFSHVIHCKEEMRTGAYRVFPRKGETWALFKNWDISWSFDPDSHREYEYEFVETMSEYSEEAGISVAYLHKVKGFSSVFCRMFNDGTGTFWIPSHELYRFSHSVPSFKLTGNEGTGIPEGSHELDPASLPQQIEEITLSSAAAKDCGSPVSNFEGIMTPESQFHKFDDDKSEDQFQTGQIWSLYSDEEGLPKCYARIQKVERKPSFKLHVSWLELKSLPENVTRWIDEKMPVCCGTFSVAKGGQDTYTNIAPFSHQIMPRSSKKRNEYAIFPEKGDIWAVYKNWSNEITIKELELEDWEYDVVEVVDGNDTGFEVLLLEKVDGFGSVFKKAMKQGYEVRMTIPQAELLRFSHHVPSWRLKEDREGTLRGCFELDPDALSRNVFRS